MLDSPVDPNVDVHTQVDPREVSSRMDLGVRFVGTLLEQRYRIVRLLASGGMGLIYEAEHLDRRVALKVLKPELAHSDANKDRFRREIQAATMIEHPNVLSPIDFGDTFDGSVFYAMELLEGEDLATRLQRDPTPLLSDVQNIAMQIIRGLAAAHECGVIHRDMKPANVFLVPGPDGGDRVKLLDFGIAKLVESDSSASTTGRGSVFGTARYMAPEQASGRPADARSDVYAVGTILYEMLSGAAPFEGESFLEVARRQATEPILPLDTVSPALPSPVCELVMKALAKHPDDRFSSMADFEVALEAAFIDTTRVIWRPPMHEGGSSHDRDFLEEEGVDETIIFDRRRPDARRPFTPVPVPAASVILDPALEATLVRPRPTPAPPSVTLGGHATPSAQARPEHRRGREKGTIEAASSPPPRQRHPSTPSPRARPLGVDPNARPRESNQVPLRPQPPAERTLPPVVPTSVGANPITDENRLPDGQAADTAEFALELPRTQMSRNWLVVLITSLCLLVVSGCVGAWLMFGGGAPTTSPGLHPAVLAKQPRAAFTPEPIDDVKREAPPEPAGPPRLPPEVPQTPEPPPKKAASPSGFSRCNAAIRECGRKHGGLEGTWFEVSFVIRDGRARDVSIQRPHDVTPLGQCVARAVSTRARFAKGAASSSRVTRRARF